MKSPKTKATSVGTWLGNSAVRTRCVPSALISSLTSSGLEWMKGSSNSSSRMNWRCAHSTLAQASSSVWSHGVPDAVLDTFHKWADESDAFAADLDEPTFSFQLMKRITPDANGTVFYMSMDHFFDDRLKRLVDLDDAAHRADRG